MIELLHAQLFKTYFSCAFTLHRFFQLWEMCSLKHFMPHWQILSNVNHEKCFLVLLYYRGTFEHDVEYKEDNNEIYVCNGNYVHCTSHTLFKNYAPQNHLKEFIFYTLWTSHLKTISVSALLYRHNRQITKNKPYDFSPFELLVFSSEY